MQNIVSLNNQESVVSLNDIVKYSGNKEKSVRDLVLKYTDRLEKHNRSLNADLKETEFLPSSKSGQNVDWSKVVLNEPQAMFLMTLLKNSEEVVEFKDKLIHQFTDMRNNLIEIREQALVDHHKEALEKVIAEKKKLNTYDNGLMSVSKIKQELQIPESTQLIFDALEHAGITYNEIIPTVYRRLCESVPLYVGSTQPGNKAPILLPAVVANNTVV